MAYRDVVGVILGGGKGTRLDPLTRMRAKPAVPLAGKYRLIDIPISNCINSGINRIYVLTQFLSASINRHVSSTYKFDTFSQGFVELLPAEQTLTSKDWYQGTADAVRRQWNEIRQTDPDDIVVLAGDHLYRMDYSDFIGFHRANRADVTLGVIPLARKDVSRFGILNVDERQKIVAYEEKPDDPDLINSLTANPDSEKPFLASMGIYVFRREALFRILETVPESDFGKHIIPALLQNSRVYAFPFEGYWEDIGTIRTFYEANLALTKPDPVFDFYDSHHPIYTRSRYLPPSRVDGCTVIQSAVSDGCKLINARIEESTVGLRSIVRQGASLRRVVMMGADFFEDHSDLQSNRSGGIPDIGIGKNTSIEQAIIDKNARIGSNVTIKCHEGEPDRDEENYVVREGIVVIPKNSIIPDGSTL